MSFRCSSDGDGWSTAVGIMGVLLRLFNGYKHGNKHPQFSSVFINPASIATHSFVKWNCAPKALYSFLDFHIFQLETHQEAIPCQCRHETSGLMESLNFPSPMTMSSSRKLLKWTSITVSRSPSSRASSMAAQIAFSADSVCVVKDCYIDKGIKAEKSKQYMSTYLLYISYMSYISIYTSYMLYTCYISHRFS